MTMRRALQVILALSIVGVAFSGTLSYRELCLADSGGCEAAPAGGLFGIPVCVYGLVMYLLVGLVAGLALRSGGRGRGHPAAGL
jgi:uncharacterized membrane protein